MTLAEKTRVKRARRLRWTDERAIRFLMILIHFWSIFDRFLTFFDRFWMVFESF